MKTMVTKYSVGASRSPSGGQGGAGSKSSAINQNSALTVVATIQGVQVTGVTRSKDGRLFANFPRWHEDLPFSVVEVMADGSCKPYPNEEWNAWDGEPKKDRFTCVQAIFAHKDSLFVLDPASPMMEGVVGSAKLHEFDLKTDQLKNTWLFDKNIAPEKSYLNDLRIDEEAGKIYITESGLGAIIMLDLTTGKPRRLLDQHASTKAEDVYLTVEGETWLKDGKQPQMHADGIALSPDKQFLYYHALTAYTLYRVPTKALNDAELEPQALGEQVENLSKTPAPDGMLFDKKGNLYMADLEKNAVVYRTPGGEIKTLVQDERIKWADTFTIGEDEMLYFTTSRLHEAVGDISQMKFHIFKTPLAEA